MIIEVDKSASGQDLHAIRQTIEGAGYTSHLDRGDEVTLVGVHGRAIPESLEDAIRKLPGVMKILRITDSYKEVSRKFHPSNTVITLENGAKIGAGELTLMVGPCGVENYSLVLETAYWAKEAGAQVLRGGAFKPRTGPYSTQGMGEAGLEILARVKQETGLPIITEILIPQDENVSVGQVIAMFERYGMDIYQVGARSAQVGGLLHALSKRNHPVLYKNGLGMTAEEFLNGAGYLLSGAWGDDGSDGGGKPNVMLCVRGTAGETTVSRFPLELKWIPYLRKKAFGLEQLMEIATVGREIFNARKALKPDYRMTNHYVDSPA